MRPSSHELLGLGLALTAVGAWGIGRPAAPSAILWRGTLVGRHLIWQGPALPGFWWAAIAAGAVVGANLPDLDQPTSRLAGLLAPRPNGRPAGAGLLTGAALALTGCLLLLLGFLAPHGTTHGTGGPFYAVHPPTLAAWLRRLPDPGAARALLLLLGGGGLALGAACLAGPRGWLPLGRRGASHSFLLLLPPLLLLLLGDGSRLPGPPGLLGGLLVSVAGHLLADALTVRGIPLTLTNHGPMVYLLPKRRRVRTGAESEVILLLALLLFLALLVLAAGFALSPFAGPTVAPWSAPSSPP